MKFKKLKFRNGTKIEIKLIKVEIIVNANKSINKLFIPKINVNEVKSPSNAFLE